MNKTVRTITLVAITTVLLSACTAGTNTAAVVADGGAGFWLGLWHGIIAPITFVISLFTDEINIYEVANNGNWYDFGFVLGAGILFGGRSGTKRRMRSRQRRTDGRTGRHES